MRNGGQTQTETHTACGFFSKRHAVYFQAFLIVLFQLFGGRKFERRCIAATDFARCRLDQ